MSVALLSMEAQRALRMHQKYLNLCSKDERRSLNDMRGSNLLKNCHF